MNATRWVEGWELIRVSEKRYYFKRARASPPRAMAIGPSTRATAPPTTPLPVPGHD